MERGKASGVVEAQPARTLHLHARRTRRRRHQPDPLKARGVPRHALGVQRRDHAAEGRIPCASRVDLRDPRKGRHKDGGRDARVVAAQGEAQPVSPVRHDAQLRLERLGQLLRLPLQRLGQLRPRGHERQHLGRRRGGQLRHGRGLQALQELGAGAYGGW